MLQGGGSTQGEPDIKKSSMPGPSALPRQARYRRHEIQGLGILFAGLGFRVRLEVLEKFSKRDINIEPDMILDTLSLKRITVCLVGYFRVQIILSLKGFVIPSTSVTEPMAG